MAASVYVGSFTKRTGTGTQAITGVGFMPKALLLWSMGATAANGGFEDVDLEHYFGLSDGTNHAAVSHVSGDALTTSNTALGYRNDAACVIVDLGGTVNSVGAVSSMDADGFTFNWTTATGASGILINFIAIGGSGVSAVVGDIATNASTGNQAVTGLGFQPSAVIFLPFPAFATAPQAVTGFGPSGIGWATNSSQGALDCDALIPDNPSVTTRYQRTAACVVANGAGGVAYEASFVSCDADGFTVDWTTARAGRLAYMALSGVTVLAGSVTQPTATGVQSVSTPGLTPAGLLLMSTGQVASSSRQTESRMSFGATDGTRQRVSWSGDANGVSPTRCARRESTTSLSLAGTPVAAGASSTLLAEAAFDAFAAEAFSLNWTTADSTGRELLYFALGTTVAGACSGGGEINVVADPDEGETFTGREIAPRAWLELAFDDQDRAFAQDSYNHPSDYYGGRKAGHLVSYGAIWRRLSYPRGSYQAANANLAVDDTARVFAALEDDATAKKWWNREARVRMASRDTIAAAGTPHTLFRGIWRGHQTASLSDRTLGFTDLLGSDFSPFQLERALPRRLITATDFPDAPTDALGRVVPIIYGKWQSTLRSSSITMTLDGVPGVFYPFGAGLLGPEVGSVATVGGNGIELNTLVDTDHRSWDVLPGTTPTGVTIASAGAGTLPATRNNSWTAMVTAIHGTVESDPAPVATIVLGSDGAVTVSWTAASGGATGGYNIYLADNPFGVATKFSTYAAAFFVGSSNVYKFHVASGTTTITISAPGDPYAFDVVYLYQVSAVFTDGSESAPGGLTLGMSHPFARPIRLRWEALTDTDLDHYIVRRAPFKGIGQDPQFDRAFTVATTTTTIDGIDQVVFVDTFDDGAAATVGAVSAPKGGPIPIIDVGSETIGGVIWGRFLVCGSAIAHIEDAFQAGVPIDASLYGVSILVPGQTGWPLGTDYVDINSRRYTLIYLKDALLASHRDGSKPVTVSGCFIEDVGDASGRTITRAPRVVAHLLEQWGVQDYQSGTWAAPATSDDGVPWLNTGSFNALEALEIARLAAYRSAVGESADSADAEGYELSLYIADSITLRDLLESRITFDTDIFIGQNQHGQLVAYHPPDAYDADTATKLKDVREIVADTPTQQKIDELETTVVFDFAYHPASGAFLQTDTGIENDTAITNNRSKDVRGDRRSLYGVQKTAQARDIARRSVTRTGRPPRYVTVTCSIHALAVHIGDVVLVTDVDGTGSSGWTDRPLWVIGIGVQIDALDQPITVILECIDAVWLTDSAPTLTTITSPAPQSTGGGSSASGGGATGNWSGDIADAVVGKVAGPTTSTDNAIARWDSTSGTVLQDGQVGESDDGRLINLTDPTSAQDAATKNYVDGIAANLGKRQRVRAATTANITISTGLNNGDTLDGVTLATGDLVLVKNQTAPEQNGVYVVGAVPARFSEFDTYDEHPGSLIAVEEGTTNADTLWLCTSNVGGTLNTTAIAFSALSVSGGITQLTGDGAAGPGSGSQVLTIPTLVGDSGAGGTKGLVPAPAAGDAAAGKFLKANGLWAAPPAGGSGNVVGTGAVGSEPGSPASGDLYLPDNGFSQERYSGSLWVPWGPIFPLTDPNLQTFAWVNQGGATVSSTKGGIYLFGPKVASANWRIRKKAAPSTPYTITVAFLAAIADANQSYNALIFRDSVSGRMHMFTLACVTAGQPSVISTKWTDATTFGGADYLIRNPTTRAGNGLHIFRIADDGTNRICSYSSDGQNFITFHTITRTDWITANEVGFGVCDTSNVFDVGMTVISWKEGP